jgi:hypothetical protein
MPTTIDQLRTAGEAKLEKLLAAVDSDQRQIIRDALRQYGRVQDVPAEVWTRLKKRIEDDDSLAAAIALLLIGADDLMIDRIDQIGVNVADQRIDSLHAYSREAARRTLAMADAVDTTRQRLARKIEDSMLSDDEQRGGVGTLTDRGIDEAIDEVFTEGRRKVAATDATTGAITEGSRTARDRVVGDDGAELKPVGGGSATPKPTGGDDVGEPQRPQRVLIDLIWRTHPELAKSGKSCPRCAPLEGTNESVWGKIYPNGPGREAHDGCNCELEPRIIVEHADTGPDTGEQN